MSKDARSNGASSRQARLARDILAYAAHKALEAGAPLREMPLAEHFRVSRTPIKAALRHLCAEGVVEHRPKRGFFLRRDAIDSLHDSRRGVSGDALYFQLARDALEWGNGFALNISDLAERYGVSRPQIQRVVEQAAREGWIENRVGYSWIVRLGIASEEDYLKFYRFREIIEPAALLEPNFAPDIAELDRFMEMQHSLAAGEYADLNAADLFEINVQIHEAIVSWSGNVFFLDALRRANALRRIIEYSKVMKTNRINAFARDHIAILEAIRASDYGRASELLREHVSLARTLKAKGSGKAD